MGETKYRGFLTETDREFLEEELGDDTESLSESEKNARKQTRYRIRERTKSAFEDFRLLFDSVSEGDRDEVFERAGRSREESPREGQRAVYDGTIAVMALIYEAHWVNNWDFENALWAALEEAHSGMKRLPRRVLDRETSTFNPALTSPADAGVDIERATEKAKTGELLTDREFRVVIERGRYPTAMTLDEFVKEQQKLRIKANTRQRYIDKNPWVGASPSKDEE